MMKNFIGYILFFGLLLPTIFLIATCNKHGIEPLPDVNYDLKVFCDTCGNDIPLTRADSMYGEYPTLNGVQWSTKFVSTSPNNRFITGEYSNSTDINNMIWKSVFIYDIWMNKSIGLFIGNRAANWSPDGRYLAMLRGSLKPQLFDISSNTLINFSFDFNFSGSRWSSDSKHLYMWYNQVNTNWKNGIYRVGIDGKDPIFIADDIVNNIFELDSTTIIYPYSHGLIKYQIPTKKREYIELEYFKSLPSSLANSDISPDKQHIVCEAYQKGGLDPGSMGLIVIDLNDFSVKKIMDNARYRPQFYPRWATNNTIFCSLFCVKEGSYTTWEIDLNGKLLRKVTNMEMKF